MKSKEPRISVGGKHRICTCLTDDGSSGGLGKPIKCYKREPVPEKATTGMVAKRCLAGCGHWHFYSPRYLKLHRLETLLNEVGLDQAVEIMANHALVDAWRKHGVIPLDCMESPGQT